MLKNLLARPQPLLARLIDPNEFAVVQSASFANFNAVRTDLLVFAAIVTVIAVIIAWRARHVLDVISLGPDVATGLGVSWDGTVAGLLLLVSALVAVSTALVGPVAFFGLLVAALAECLVDSRRHGLLLPAAAFSSAGRFILLLKRLLCIPDPRRKPALPISCIIRIERRHA